MDAAPRRSTRQRAPIATSAAVATSSTQPQAQAASQDVDENDSEDEFQEPQSGKRKRKSIVDKGKSSKPQSKAAKKRKGQGILEQLTEMPFDILFEIFGHLLPCDLLSLSRTSKDFRQFVLGRGFKSIWIHSRKHVEGLPDCPDDLSEPMYAELAFGKGCLVCGKGGVTVLIWQARTRLCYSCIDDIYVTNSYISRLGLPATLVDRVPKTRLRHKQRYSPVYGHKWAEEYKALKTPEEKQRWEEAKIAQSEIAKQHAYLCQDWQRTFSQMGSYQKMDEKRDRKARMVQLAKSMGWDNDLVQVLEEDPEIDRLCSRKLTDKAFENARFLIDRIMKEAKEQRTLQERKDMYKSRIQALKNAYQNSLDLWHSPLQPRPRVSDIFMIPRIKSLVVDTPPEITVDTAHFNFTKDTLPLVIEEANNIIKQKLLDMVDEGLKDVEHDPATVLDLASTVFVNPSYSYRNVFMPTRQVLYLKPDHDYYYASSSKGNLESIAYEVFQMNPWGHNISVHFNRPAHDAVCKVLTFCGFDPLTATAAEVNKADPIIECLDCNQCLTGRLLMRWQKAASHLLQNHDNTNNFSLADDTDAARTRAKLREEDEVKDYREGVQARCKHCEYTSRITDTRRHLWEQHDVTYPEVTDLEIAERTARAESCRLWPARPT